jgi:hypothetical protein
MRKEVPRHVIAKGVMQSLAVVEIGLGDVEAHGNALTRDHPFQTPFSYNTPFRHCGLAVARAQQCSRSHP